MFRGKSGEPAESEGAGDQLTPEELAAYESGLEELDAQKRRALLDPGPSWKQWFFYDAAKWWIGVGFLIVDVLAAGSWFAGGALSTTTAVEAVLTLVPLLYVEALLYLYLWRHPSDADLVRHGPFRPSWKALREVGRWTPEAEARRAAARGAAVGDSSPQPDEFL